MNKPVAEKLIGWQYYFVKNIKARNSEIESFNKLVINARTPTALPVKIKVSLITAIVQHFLNTSPLPVQYKSRSISILSKRIELYYYMALPGIYSAMV